jgi:hypothetical protein
MYLPPGKTDKRSLIKVKVGLDALGEVVIRTFGGTVGSAVLKKEAKASFSMVASTSARSEVRIEVGS